MEQPDDLAKIDAQIDWLRNHWGIGENIHGKAIRELQRRRRQLLREHPSLVDIWRANWRLMPGLFGPARVLHTIALTRRHYARKK